MRTFLEAFCAARGCAPIEFNRRVFWHCVHRRAVVVVPFLGGADADYFAPDLDLVGNVGRAVRMGRVRIEIGDYFLDARNHGWLRRRAKVRIGTQRLNDLAKQYLPDDRKSHPPVQTLLVIDDNKSDSDALLAWFTRRGFVVLTAENGADGLAMITYLKADAVIVKVELSGIHGAQLCRAAREQTKTAGKDLPVWLVTNSPTAQLTQLATAAGAECLLSQPIDLVALSRLIEKRLSSS